MCFTFEEQRFQIQTRSVALTKLSLEHFHIRFIAVLFLQCADRDGQFDGQSGCAPGELLLVSEVSKPTLRLS